MTLGQPALALNSLRVTLECRPVLGAGGSPPRGDAAEEGRGGPARPPPAGAPALGGGRAGSPEGAA